MVVLKDNLVVIEDEKIKEEDSEVNKELVSFLRFLFSLEEEEERSSDHIQEEEKKNQKWFSFFEQIHDVLREKRRKISRVSPVYMSFFVNGTCAPTITIEEVEKTKI